MSSRIRIQSAADHPPLTQPMPIDDSLEWLSPFENHVAGHVCIFFAQSAYRKCVEHTASGLGREVGGMLIGEVRVDPTDTRPHIVIQDILPALHTNSGQTHVTFTQDTLVQLNTELEDRFPGKHIVGWYHTHPKLGVFLSNYDTWLHENFFNEPTQVALVVDPDTMRGGFFCWQGNRRLDPVHYVGFYEWADVSDESIVEWGNLEPVPKE